VGRSRGTSDNKVYLTAADSNIFCPESKCCEARLEHLSHLYSPNPFNPLGSIP
jgi:hypothetical protein